MAKAQTKTNQTNQNGTEPNEEEEKQLTPEEIKEQEKAAARARAEEEKRQREERETALKAEIMYFERTIPYEMACNWLTKAAKNELEMGKDSVVLFRMQMGDLVIGCLPDGEK